MTSAIVMHELFYGAHRSGRTDHNLALVEQIALPVLGLSPEDARAAGEVRARLAAAGRPIGPFDVLIAGQALSRGLTLVTANVAELDRIEGLVVEDWSAPGA